MVEMFRMGLIFLRNLMFLAAFLSLLVKTVRKIHGFEVPLLSCFDDSSISAGFHGSC